MSKVKKIKLEKEMYQEAKQKGLSFTQFLEKLENEEGIEYSGKLSELDAYQRQLMAYGIKVAPGEASLVSDFFKTTASAIIFPEFWNRNIMLGMLQGKLSAKLEDIIATRTMIDSKDYRGLFAEVDEQDVKMKRVAEGAEFPKISFKLDEQAISLEKIGIVIESSYEALRLVGQFLR